MFNFSKAQIASHKPSTIIDKQQSSTAKLTPLIALAASQFFFSSCSKSPPMTERAELPTNFTAQASLLSIGTDIILSDSQGPFASIEERTLNLTPTFQYFDASHHLSAQAKQKIFSLGTKIEICDENNKPLGSVEEIVWESFFKVQTSYQIKDASGKEVGKSEKLDWSGTTFKISDYSGRELIKMTRPMFDLGGATWTINVEKDLPFDKRLVLFVPAFKTAADAAREEEAEAKKEKKDKENKAKEKKAKEKKESRSSKNK